MNDQLWIKTEVPKADTPEKALQLILENEAFLGYDSYYADLRDAMLNQARTVLIAHGVDLTQPISSRD